MTRLLVVGATGLVGNLVLQKALADPRVAQVVAPTRRPVAAHPKLTNPIVDFARLPEDTTWWNVNSLVCALGTTRAIAGSDEAFRTVDHGYPLAVAVLARRHGATTFALNSSMGADASSRLLYTRTKGEIERDIAALGFASLTIVRPGLIGGDRADFRLVEQVSSLVLRAFRPLLPRRYRISQADRIAAALVEAAISARTGHHIIKADAFAGD